MVQRDVRMNFNLSKVVHLLNECGFFFFRFSDRTLFITLTSTENNNALKMLIFSGSSTCGVPSVAFINTTSPVQPAWFE